MLIQTLYNELKFILVKDIFCVLVRTCGAKNEVLLINCKNDCQFQHIPTFVRTNELYLSMSISPSRAPVYGQ